MTQEYESRMRGNSLIDRVSALRSRPSSSSSSKQFKSAGDPISSNARESSSPHKLDRFEYFSRLPSELRAYILTFLPSKVLHKTIGRTNRYYKDLVESHIRRRILTLMSPGPWDVRSTADNYQAPFVRMPNNVLMFEAQRPIDTLTTKHTLYFSHFSKTTSEDEGLAHGNGSSTLVHFSFVPVEADARRSQSADSNLTSSSGSGQSNTSSVPPSSLPAQVRNPLAGTFGQPHYPIVHEQDQERLQYRDVTSSVSVRPTRSGTSTPRAVDNSDRRRRPFTDVSSPMEWRETSLTSTRLVMDDGEGEQQQQQTQEQQQPSATQADRSSQRAQGSRARGRGYEGFYSSAPQVNGLWSEPIASSSAAYDGDGNEETHQSKLFRSQQHRKPTYRFQLDPLDSFETWILALTLQRRPTTKRSSQQASVSQPSRARPMRWEKRVAEGLDRVFRDWFHPSINSDAAAAAGMGGGGSSWSAGGSNSALHRASLIASMGSGHASSMPTSAQAVLSDTTQEEVDEADWQETAPDAKMLEFDGLSCTLMIQPHPIASSSPLHPALTSMSSHHYLSNSSLSSQFHASLTSRVEFTFHCESLSINAARLLGVLEDVERDVEQANDMAKLRGAQVVAGSSGGTTWAYSTGGSGYATSETTTTTTSASSASRWTSSGPGGLSVLVFGAARD